MINMGTDLPQFAHDLLASPPRRGAGLNNWFYRAARALHPFRTPAEIEQLLGAATAGEPVKPGEIERAVARSKEAASQPGYARPYTRSQSSPWPAPNIKKRHPIIS